MMNPCTNVQGFFMTDHKPGWKQKNALPIRPAVWKSSHWLINLKTGPPSAKRCQAGPISFQKPAQAASRGFISFLRFSRVLFCSHVSFFSHVFISFLRSLKYHRNRRWQSNPPASLRAGSSGRFRPPSAEALRSLIYRCNYIPLRSHGLPHHG